MRLFKRYVASLNLAFKAVSAYVFPRDSFKLKELGEKFRYQPSRPS
jgi:hypothetical protein